MATSSGFSATKQGRQPTGFRALIICSLISVLLLTFYVREGESGPLHVVRGVVTTATTPFRLAGSLAAAPFGALGQVASNLTASTETLSELKAENEKLTAKVAELTEAEKTAERLQALVGLKSTYNLQSTAARIIGTAGDAWSRTVTIDKGSSSGFATGMPVCNSGGVIGQIIEVSATTSTVRLITDENSGVSAMIQSTRAQGTLKGQPDGSLKLEYVPADADVKEGDIVITSGLGGVFPKGLPLGTVSSVEKATNAVYYTISVRADASAESNEEVLVVTALTDDQSATTDEVASANSTPQGGSASSTDASSDATGTSQDSSSSTSSSSTSKAGA